VVLDSYQCGKVPWRYSIICITAAVDSRTGGLFFIDGPGGTGKTFVENLLLSYVRSTGSIALSVASSGIASILLDGGRTSHSRFKIPIDIQQDSICDIKAQTSLADLIRRTKLIIWDEAPAQHRYCFEAVDRTFKDICNCEKWFGGITMVFGGMTSSQRLPFNYCRSLSSMFARCSKGFQTSNSSFYHFKCHILERCAAVQVACQHAPSISSWAN